MNEKVNLQQLAEILSVKTGWEKAQTGQFLETLVSAVNEAIVRDRTAHIKGLGTFKIKWMKERKSSDVNTQEPIIIPAHHKLAFEPEESFGELVNRQYSCFEAVETKIDAGSITDIPPSGESDDEITVNEKITVTEKDSKMEEKRYPMPPIPTTATNKVLSENLLPETGDDMEQTQLIDNAREVIHDEEQTQLVGASGQEQLADEEQTCIIGARPEPEEETQLIGRPTANEEKAELTQLIGNVDEKTPDEQTQLLNEPPQDNVYPGVSGTKEKKKSLLSNPTAIAIGIVVLLALCIGAGYLYYSTNKGKTGRISGELALPGDSVALKEAEQKAKITAEVDAEATDSTTTAAQADSTALDAAAGTAQKNTDQPKQTASTTQKSTKNTPAKTSPAKTSPPKTGSSPANTASSGKTLANVRMAAGSRLTLLALEYYGDKIFWVYIYDFNKATIGPNPDYVPVGTEIRIPAKDVYGIDANSAASREKARQLQAKLKKK